MNTFRRIDNYDLPINIWEAMTNYDLPINIWETVTNTHFLNKEFTYLLTYLLTLIYSVIFYLAICFVGKTHRNIVPWCFVNLELSQWSVINWFKKRWLSVVWLARATNKNIKMKVIVHIAFVLYYNSSWLNCMCVLSIFNVSDTILPNSWVDT